MIWCDFSKNYTIFCVCEQGMRFSKMDDFWIESSRPWHFLNLPNHSWGFSAAQSSFSFLRNYSFSQPLLVVELHLEWSVTHAKNEPLGITAVFYFCVFYFFNKKIIQKGAQILEGFYSEIVHYFRPIFGTLKKLVLDPKRRL